MMEKFNRELVRGSLDLMVLSVLADGPKYGYLIQKELREASQGLVRGDAGTLYPLLHRLEADKLIKAKWEQGSGRPRKWYELTAAGRRRWESQARDWQRYAACIQKLLSPLGPLDETVAGEPA